MDLGWNYKQNNQSWNDCISSYCFNFQPGARAMCFGVYKDAAFASGLCNKKVHYVYDNDIANGTFIPCHNDITNAHFGSVFCKTLNDDISSLRMQVVWQGCSASFHDF